MIERLSGIVAEVRGARFIIGKSAPTKGFFEGTKPMCSMVQVGLNYRFGLQSTEDAAQNGDDLRRDPLEVRKTTRARLSYFRDCRYRRIHLSLTVLRDQGRSIHHQAGHLTWIRTWKTSFASALTRSGPRMVAYTVRPISIGLRRSEKS
jgi:hypothetical protein